MSNYEMTPVERAMSYRNSGYNPEGIWQYKDGSGYISLEHPDDGLAEVNLPTKGEVKELASKLMIDIQQLDI